MWAACGLISGLNSALAWEYRGSAPERDSDQSERRIAREWIESIRSASAPSLAACEVLKRIRLDGHVPDSAVRSFFGLVARDPILQAYIIHAHHAFQESAWLGAPLRIESGAKNLRIRLEYFGSRLRSMQESAIPGFFYGSTPILDEKVRGRVGVLLGRIAEELAVQSSTTSDPRDFIRRVSRVRKLGAEFLALEHEFESKRHERLHVEIAQDIDQLRQVSDWVKGASFDALAWMARVRALPLGIQASIAAGASTQSVLCALDRTYIDWTTSSGTVSEAVWAANLAVCAAEGAVSAVSMGASLKVRRAIDIARMGWNAAEGIESGLPMLPDTEDVPGPILPPGAVLADGEGGEGGFGPELLFVLQVEPGLEHYGSEEGWAGLVLDTLMSRRDLRGEGEE